MTSGLLTFCFMQFFFSFQFFLVSIPVIFFILSSYLFHNAPVSRFFLCFFTTCSIFRILVSFKQFYCTFSFFSLRAAYLPIFQRNLLIMLHRVSKSCHQTVSISFLNIDQFSKFYHQIFLMGVCQRKIIKIDQ